MKASRPLPSRLIRARSRYSPVPGTKTRPGAYLAGSFGAPLMDSAIGLTPEGRLSAGEPRADAAPTPAPVADRVSGDPLLEGLQAFVSGRQRTLNQPLAEIELHLVRLAMERTGGNITAAAQMLGMSRAQVSYRLKGN